MAAAVGKLVYYPDNRPGIRRKRCGRGFTYVSPEGLTIERGKERERLEAIGVPPAYRKVWLSPIETGHLQATGYDARERKQYRYHPDWSSARAETKFSSLAEFGAALPAIRRHVAKSLRAEAGEKEFAVAAALALIDRLAIRVGDPAYTEENGSYGAVTLKSKHLRLHGDRLALSFSGKGGKAVRRQLTDKGLARALTKARELSGAQLITWRDEEERLRSISSSDLNEVLAEVGGEGFTTKTFRTWAGTLAAYSSWRAGAATTIKAMSEEAAQSLHNTPAIARSSYIHPAVIDLAGEEPRDPGKLVTLPGLRQGEPALLAFLNSL